MPASTRRRSRSARGSPRVRSSVGGRTLPSCGNDDHRARAWCTTCWLTEPSSRPRKPPRPREPTTRQVGLGRLGARACRAGWPSRRTGVTRDAVPAPTSATSSSSAASASFRNSSSVDPRRGAQPAAVDRQGGTCQALTALTSEPRHLRPPRSRTAERRADPSGAVHAEPRSCSHQPPPLLRSVTALESVAAWRWTRVGRGGSEAAQRNYGCRRLRVPRSWRRSRRRRNADGRKRALCVRRGRRDPPRRRHAPARAPAARGCGRPRRRSSRGLSERSLLPAVPRLPRRRRSTVVEPLLDPDWTDARRARRHAGRRATASRDRRARELRRARATPTPPRWRSPSPTTEQGRGHRDAPARAARAARARRPGSTRFVAEVLAANTRDARRLRRRRVRGRARRSSAARSRCASRSRRRAIRGAGRASATTSQSSPRCARSSSRESVAVIGASRRRGSIGGELFRNILAADFAGAAYPGEPARRAGRRRARVSARSRRSTDAVDLAVICLPGEQVLDAAAAALACGVPRALRHLGGLRRDRARRARERQERAARARPRARRQARRPELPRHRRSGRIGLNATFAPRALPAGSHRLLVAERRARARAAREGGGAEPRLLVASSRSATRRTSRRTTCSSGGRTTTRRTSCCSTSSRSATRATFARIARRRRAPQADPGAEGRRDVAPARAPRARTRPRSPAPTRRSTRCSTRPACCARGRSRSSSTRRLSSRASRCRAGAASA